MQLVCPHCSQVLEIRGAPPSFCAYCGNPIADKARAAVPDTATFDPEAPTLAPSGEADSLTIGSGPPLRVGSYRLLRVLGSGGMGTVYEAEDQDSGQHVALKLIAQEFATSRETAERFRQEGRLASAITHPRCVFVRAADAADGRPYIVMELMPGDTLKDLVERGGPLSVNDAIAKTLDVIDGLLEAHRLEVIHRDVKPSNCFLEADGRVKVGDFGLAKSLVKEGSANLTRTGTFLGTPYFASPEQVRGEPLDPQTDVYSVAATLYYLLTGRPPFHGSDAASTLARIVADPAPPMRTVRPDLPKALDRVVLKGLDRDRRRRYQDLTEFREALVALLPRQVSLRGMGFRLGAYILDGILGSLALYLFKLIVIGLAGLLWREWLLGVTWGSLVAIPGAVALWIGYFTVSESIWHCSLGKFVLRLRVAQAEGPEPPSVASVLLRSTIFVLMLHLGLLVMTAVYLVRSLSSETGAIDATWTEAVLAYGWAPVGALLLATTMRRANGYRGLHELLSGTRVVQLPWPRKRPTPISTLGWFLYLKRSKKLAGEGSSHMENLPKTVGGFAIRGGMRLSRQEHMLLGEDSSLGRKVAILLRAETASPLDPKRRDLGRITRPRWIAGGKLKSEQWDAFLAPQGCPLPDLIASERRLPWSEVRPVLEQLAEELQFACEDGTLPASLSLEQIWVQQNGRVQLTDWVSESANSSAQINVATTDQARCLDLLRRVVVLALEGQARPADASPEPIRAPLPEHARAIVDKLLGIRNPYTKLSALRSDLAAAQDSPTEVDATLRAGQLALSAAGLVPCLLVMFALGALLPSILEPESGYLTVTGLALAPSLIIPLGCIIWVLIMRGGLSFSAMGLALVDAKGQPASMGQCLVRSVVMWLPIILVLSLAVYLPTSFNDSNPLPWFKYCWLGCWVVVLLVLLVYMFLVLLYPGRSLHDQIADTYVVPR